MLRLSARFAASAVAFVIGVLIHGAWFFSATPTQPLDQETSTFLAVNRRQRDGTLSYNQPCGYSYSGTPMADGNTWLTTAEIRITPTVLRTRTTNRPNPIYPTFAREARASGSVVVQIFADETGRVVSAFPVSGHPLLRRVATEAACGTRFEPALVSGHPTPFTGALTYSFVLE